MRRSRPFVAGSLAAALAVLTAACGGVALGDATALPNASSDQAAAPEAPPAKEVPDEMQSPRAVLRAFVERMRADKKREAAELLDLSELSAVAAESRASDLAYKLYSLVPALGIPPRENATGGARSWRDGNADAPISFEKAPDDPAFEGPWPLSSWLLQPNEEASQIVVARDEAGHWRFSSETVASIDPLYEQYEELIDEKAAARRAEDAANGAQSAGEPTVTPGVWLRQLFPPSFRTTYFLLPTYQWLLLIGLFPLSRIAEKVSRGVLTWVGDRVLHQIDPEFIEAHESTADVWHPVGRLVNAAVWTYGAHVIELPSDVTSVLLTLLVIVTIVMGVLAVFRLLDLVAGYFVRRSKRLEKRAHDMIVPLVASTAKIGAVLVGVIAMIAAFNDELPATLLGGLGIGGIAIALASQETLSNFIGSIALILDRPFEVGDFVKVDGIEGTVESLGFRSTVLRTPLDSLVSMPNNKLAGAVIDNWGRRKYRRYFAKLGLEYGTPPERIEAFCEGVRELIRRHPHTRKDFYTAYFNDYGPSSLDVLVVCFFEVPDWPTELRERERLLADILRLAEKVGVSFAFPTQTLHVHRGEEPEVADLTDPDPDLAGARAAAKIAGELPNYQDRPGKVKFPGPTNVD